MAVARGNPNPFQQQFDRRQEPGSFYDDCLCRYDDRSSRCPLRTATVATAAPDAAVSPAKGAHAKSARSQGGDVDYARQSGTFAQRGSAAASCGLMNARVSGPRKVTAPEAIEHLYLRPRWV